MSYSVFVAPVSQDVRVYHERAGTWWYQDENGRWCRVPEVSARLAWVDPEEPQDGPYFYRDGCWWWQAKDGTWRKWSGISLDEKINGLRSRPRAIRKRAARPRPAPSTFRWNRRAPSKRVVASLWKRQKGRCWYCKAKLGGFENRKGRWDVDHLVPIARGGSNNPDNLVIACGQLTKNACNHRKRDKLPHEFPAQGQPVLPSLFGSYHK